MSATTFDLLTEAILERDQPRTTDLFFRMVRRENRPLGEALGVVTAAEAPFVQVPSHIDVRDGQITLINNCLLYTSPSPRDRQKSRMPSSA